MTPLHAIHAPPVREPGRRRVPGHPRTHTASSFSEKPARYELRSDKSALANVWAISHCGGEVDVELTRGGIPVLQGRIDGQLTVAGNPVKARGAWQNVCSEVNDDAAYIELQRDLEGGGRIDRQFFLARRDAFAIIADAVCGSWEGAGEYQLQIPLADRTQWLPASESTEGWIRAGRQRAGTVIPFCLPEWRGEPGGTLAANESHLRLTLPASKGVYAALFLDLSPRRFRRPLTWRRLTVGESLAAVPQHVAVGYRVQIGTSQWLIYRSLAPVASRSILGQNLRTEFLVARFLTKGTIDELLEIE